MGEPDICLPAWRTGTVSTCGRGEMWGLDTYPSQILAIGRRGAVLAKTARYFATKATSCQSNTE
jgi:hypothetical protein